MGDGYVSRPGLYIMVALTLLHTCQNDTSSIKNELRKQNKTIDRLVEKVSPTIQKRQFDADGNGADLYLEIDGKKFYHTIQGEPVEKYFNVLPESEKPPYTK